MIDGRKHAHHRDRERQDDDRNHHEGKPPAEGVAERGADGYAEHEGSRCACTGYSDRTRDLMRRNKVRRIGTNYRPKQSVREPANDTRDNQYRIVWRCCRKEVADDKDQQHDDNEGFAGVVARESSERSR